MGRIALKEYRGIRSPEHGAMVFVADGPAPAVGHTLDPKPSQKIRNHSPDGFEWGYSGSGPAQLALAILLDYLGDALLAERLYQYFKEDMLAPIPRNCTWVITGESIDEWRVRRGGIA